MTAERFATVTLSALCAAFLHAPAMAQAYAGLVGTMEVTHQRQQREGRLEGCSVVFRAVFLDFANRGGKPVMVAGNFTYYVYDPDKAYVTLKAGMRDLEPVGGATEAPAYAYIQSRRGTTAGAQRGVVDLDTPGYRMWLLPLSKDVLSVMADVLDGGVFTLGLTRNKGGLDVLVPIDLNVAETTITPDGSFRRRKTDEAVAQFAECFTQASSALSK